MLFHVSLLNFSFYDLGFLIKKTIVTEKTVHERTNFSLTDVKKLTLMQHYNNVVCMPLTKQFKMWKIEWNHYTNLPEPSEKDV